MRQFGRSGSKLSFLFLSASAIITLFSFQNCGKAGFDETGAGDSDLSSTTTLDARMTNAPFPIEANLNHISYMSCPAAGASSRRDAVDLLNPYFSIRAGAYDNQAFATQFRLDGLGAEEKALRLRAGLGLKQEFINHVANQYHRTDNDILLQSYVGSPKIQDFRLAMALISESDRSVTAPGGFGFDYSLKTILLGKLSDPAMANYLVGAPRNGNSGTLRNGFFSAYEAQSRAIEGSLTYGKNELERSNFVSALGNTNLVLALGYMKDSSMSDITQMLSPDTNNLHTVYGRGYRLGLATQNADGMMAGGQFLLTSIEEVNLEKSPVESVAAAEGGQRWDCFSLRVVRDIDRYDSTGRIYTTPGVYSATGANNAVIPGVRVACPVQNLESVTPSVNDLYASTTENGVSYRKNLLRMLMARRVLPADLWEINTGPEYLCAVPTDLAMRKGACYASGDKDTSKYIQYSGACGGNSNECAAHVSICYRSY